MVTAKEGDTIKVSFEGVVQKVESVGNLSTCLVVRSKNSGFTHALYRGAHPDFTVTSKVPDNWPARDGDVWASKENGVTFHVIGSTFYRKDRFSNSLVSRTADEALANSSDLRLVHRKF